MRTLVALRFVSALRASRLGPSITEPTGKRARITLGRYPSTSLANARARALEAKSAVADGRDPRGVGNEMTVNDLAASYIQKHTANLRSADEIKRRIYRNLSHHHQGRDDP